MATKFDDLLSAYNTEFQKHKALKQECFGALQSLIDPLCRELNWSQDLVSLSFDGETFTDLPKIWGGNLLSTDTRPYSQGIWMLWIGFELAARNSLYPYTPAPLTLAIPLFFGMVEKQFRLCIKTDALDKKVFEFYNPSQEKMTEIAESIYQAILKTLSESIWKAQEKGETGPIKLWTPPDDDKVDSDILSIGDIEAMAKMYG